VLIGAISGVLVVFAVPMFDRLRIDDPVGALSVHLVNGIWGTLSIGLFADAAAAPVTGPANGLFFGGGLGQLWVQFIGVVAAGAYTLGVGLLAFAIIRAVMGLRVSPEEEMEGLDIGEHGNSAYPDFQLVMVGSGLMGGGVPGGSAGQRAAMYAVSAAAESA